mmetsp:Transcript_17124/g.21654  ORF Transcript_17124/g.21654 Transcript_17124/m.21654 type:complete len:101 (-) Transcript_17124:15-317(-)
MCGIGFILLPQEAVSAKKNSKSSANKDGITLHQMIDERLQKNISFRGPDLPFSKKDMCTTTTRTPMRILRMSATIAPTTTMERELRRMNANVNVTLLPLP